jgi:hypothetical protein
MSHYVNGITMVIRVNSPGLSLRYNRITPLTPTARPRGRYNATLAAAIH